MTISIKPTASGSTIEQDGSTILTVDGSGNISIANDLSVTGTAPIPDALSTASGSAPSYSARAWVNFNGTGTVAIRDSGNVSSITDNGVGDYTVNFTTAMPDGNYSVAGSASSVISQLIMSPYSAATVIAASARIFISNTTAGGDNALICVAIFR